MNEDLQALVPAPEPNHRRKGKVARLPKVVRDELNQMILDGVSYPDILQTLGAKAAGLNEVNLSNWKAGGHQDWLRQQLRLEHLHSRHELALDILRESAGTTIQEASRQVVAAQLCEIMVEFDPTYLLGHLQQKPELYTRLISGLARLSEGEATCSRTRAQVALLNARLAREQSSEAPNIITEETLRIAQDRLRLR